MDAAHAAPRRRSFRRLSVLVPVYNERWTLDTILRRILDAPLPLEREIVAVDDGSTDGSWDELQRLASQEPRLRTLRHARNRGKGAAIRTAISAMTGDVAIVQDADLEYDPQEYQRLLAPILEDRADAVFGSRYAGGSRQVHCFWHTLANRTLTFCTNVLFNTTLSDMETCYKLVRADLLRQLRLTSNTFTFEPELTARLLQAGARLFEVPISYAGRSFHEGKKIRAIDGVKAIAEMLRCRLLDTRFCVDARRLAATRLTKARGYQRWLARHVQPQLGRRVLQVGATLAAPRPAWIHGREFVLVDDDVTTIERLERRFGHTGRLRFLHRGAEIDADGLVNLLPDADTILVATGREDWRQNAIEAVDRLAAGSRVILISPSGWRSSAPLSGESVPRVALGSTIEPALVGGANGTSAACEIVLQETFGRLFGAGRTSDGSPDGLWEHLATSMVWNQRLLGLSRLADRALRRPGIVDVCVARRRQPLSKARAA